jgi:hypothetical protein
MKVVWRLASAVWTACFFIERLGRGDEHDLSYQFSGRLDPRDRAAKQNRVSLGGPHVVKIMDNNAVAAFRCEMQTTIQRSPDPKS